MCCSTHSMKPNRAIVSELVLDLASRADVRVLIGAGRPLLGAVPESALVVDLDREPYADPAALTTYVRDLLVAREEADVTTPYQQLEDEQRRPVAEAISEIAGGSFGIGQLVALSLRDADRAVDVSTATWKDDLPANVEAAFEASLHAWVSTPPQRTHY